MPGGMTIEALLRERSPLYERYADLTVDVTASEIAENMEKLVAVYQSFRNQ
jgi:shikimate kinase